MIQSLHIREICMNNELIEVKLLCFCFVIYLLLAFYFVLLFPLPQHFCSSRGVLINSPLCNVIERRERRLVQNGARIHARNASFHLLWQKKKGRLIFH